jgi:hypothetical protein
MARRMSVPAMASAASTQRVVTICATESFGRSPIAMSRTLCWAASFVRSAV